MPKLELGVDSGFYDSIDDTYLSQNCINLYPKHAESKDAISKGALFRTPGVVQSDTVQGVGRGITKDTKNDALYIVAGTTLYRKDTFAGLTTIGTISGTGHVSMAWNGLVLTIIVPGSAGYFYTVAGGLVAIVDAIFVDFMNNSQGGVTSVCYKDSRFIYTTDDEFFVGSVIATNSGRDFDALDYEDAEVKSDPIVRAMNIKNELYIFGKETIELYQNTGAAFPYDRIPGATIEKGLISRFGIVPFDNSFMFLGADTLEAPGIWRGGSGAATKLSTSAIDAVLQDYTRSELESVTAWTYNEGGSFFAGFNLPDRTFVYDATASMIQQRNVWHERKSNNTKYRIELCANMFGYNMVLDNVDGRVGYLTRDTYTEYDTAIDRTWSGGYLHGQGNSFKISSLELKCTAGTGNVADPNPTVEMFISTDGGNTFNSLGTKAIGANGEFNKRLIWRRLGRVAHNVMFKFTSSNQVAVDFYRIDIDLRGSQ